MGDLRTPSPDSSQSSLTTVRSTEGTISSRDDVERVLSLVNDNVTDEVAGAGATQLKPDAVLAGVEPADRVPPVIVGGSVCRDSSVRADEAESDAAPDVSVRVCDATGQSGRASAEGVGGGTITGDESKQENDEDWGTFHTGQYGAKAQSVTASV
jgi:hypothetical protein